MAEVAEAAGLQGHQVVVAEVAEAAGLQGHQVEAVCPACPGTRTLRS